MSPRLVWFVQPDILRADEEYPEEVLRTGLMREMSREQWEYHEELKRREEWDKKHPKCEECGQFLKKRPPRVKGSLEIRLGSDFEDLWYSHYVRDYWGEYDHI